MDDASKRLTEEEVADILERATRLPARSSEEGLTVDELRDVAREVNIPSEALSQALREVARSARDEELSTRSWGHRGDTAVVEITVSDKELAWVIRLLDRLNLIQGGVDYDPKAGGLRWKSREGYTIHLLCRPSETRITVVADDRPHLFRSGLLFMGGGAAWVVAISPFLGDLGQEVLVSIGVGASVGAAGWAAYWRERMARVQQSVTRLLGGISDTLTMVAGRSEEERP